MFSTVIEVVVAFLLFSAVVLILVSAIKGMSVTPEHAKAELRDLHRFLVRCKKHIKAQCAGDTCEEESAEVVDDINAWLDMIRRAHGPEGDDDA